MKLAATFLAIVLMSVGTFAQGTAKQPPLDKAFAPLQGTWVINDINGQAPPAMLLVFKGDKYEQVVDSTVNERGTIKLTTAQKPIGIDLVIEEGSDAGKLQVGIVEVTGDKMRLKLGLPGAAARPKSFDVVEGELMVNMTRKK